MAIVQFAGLRLVSDCHTCLCHSAGEMIGLFPYSVERVLRRTNVTDDQVAEKFRVRHLHHHVLNMNAQILSNPA
jgi:hypothetical protein